MLNQFQIRWWGILLLAVSLVGIRPVAADHIYSDSTKSPWVPIIRMAAKQRNIPSALALAIVENESNFYPKAILPEPKIHTASVGLFQILHTTAKSFGFQGSIQDLMDPQTNIRLGLAYLSRCIKERGLSTIQIACCYQAGFKAKDSVCKAPVIQNYARDLSVKWDKWKRYERSL